MEGGAVVRKRATAPWAGPIEGGEATAGRLPAGDGGDESEFGAWGDGGGVWGVLGIEGDAAGGEQGGEGWIGEGEEAFEVGDGGAWGKVELDGRGTDEAPGFGEEVDGDQHG